MSNLILIIIAVVFCYFLFFLPEARNRKRSELSKSSFPVEWEAILKRNVPIYYRLPSEFQRELRGHISIFLAEKNFEGCAGLELTDEIKVTIAAHACVLLLGRTTGYYSALQSILVYPSHFASESISRIGDHILSMHNMKLGESWALGFVVLAWDEIQKSAFSIEETDHNLVFHEFAHQLDQEDGRADGAPILENLSQYRSWARVLSREYEALTSAIAQGLKTDLDPYGATSPMEFFAVLTEAFFCNPTSLFKQHQVLFDELKSFYKVDPRE